MVLVTQSTVNEDSQGRQLRVSKKLSKAISSVPRSRFQKPRPNLPGPKRSEPNAPSTRKANETAQNTIITKTENSKVNETTENTVITKTENSKVNELSPKSDVIESATTTVNTLDISSSNEIVSASENLSINEAAQSDNTEIVVEKIVTDEVSQDVDSVKLTNGVIVIEKSQSADELKKSLSTDEASESNPAKVSKNLIRSSSETSYSDATEKSHSDTTENSISTNESVQELSGEKTLALEVPDSFDIPPINTPNNNDKSFKYPHLTSILSKKRAEPKKEVQHKKRKKFKKGDTAPERSKMTMADLIYWNPTNTEPPAKSADIEFEIPANLNVDDPEESPDIDASVEENNICDSVPKLVISEDGSINIDQSSLVVSRNIAEPTSTEVIRKDDTTYSSFRKRPMTKHWTAKDTTIFYKALSLVGTDFGLMEKIFPHRTRRELKLKFKREEKFNIDLINRAMYESHLTFDANTLGDLIKNLNDLTGDFSSENGQEDSQSSRKEEKKKPAKRKRKSTKVTEPVDSVVSDPLTEPTDSVPSDTLPVPIVDEITVVGNKIKTKRRRKTKKLPDDFINADEIEEILLDEEEIREANSNVETPCELNSTEAEVSPEKNLPEKENLPGKENTGQNLSEKEDTGQNLCQKEDTGQNLSEKEDTGQNLSEKEDTGQNLPEKEDTGQNLPENEDTGQNLPEKENPELQPSVPNSDDISGATNIEILCIDDITGVDFSAENNGTILVVGNASDKSEVITIEDNGCEKEIETISLVTDKLEYVDVNESGDITLLNNVMAFEVVASNTPIPKRRRKTNFTPKLPKRDVPKPCQPIKLSSTNYTPV